MNELTKLLGAGAAALAIALAGCGKDSPDPVDEHAGHDHGADAHDHDHADDGHDHADEIPLGTTMVGDIKVECAQGHGEVAPGKELHLVVKLLESDRGASTIRAWIGTQDRLSSVVAKADYAPSHDDYDVHAVAPDPLPENAQWWIEITRPDGTTSVGSIDLH